MSEIEHPEPGVPVWTAASKPDWTDPLAQLRAMNERLEQEKHEACQQLAGAVSQIGELQDALADALSGDSERIDQARDVLAVYEAAATHGGR